MARVVLGVRPEAVMIAADEWALVSGLGLVLLGSIGAVSAYLQERRQWNGGCCEMCGQPWLYFTTDSQRSLGFRCGCGRCCWISYRSVAQKCHPPA